MKPSARNSRERSTKGRSKDLDVNNKAQPDSAGSYHCYFFRSPPDTTDISPSHSSLQNNRPSTSEKVGRVGKAVLASRTGPSGGWGKQRNDENGEIRMLKSINAELRQEILELRVAQLYQVDGQKVKSILSEVEALKTEIKRLKQQNQSLQLQNDFLRRTNDMLKKDSPLPQSGHNTLQLKANTKTSFDYQLQQPTPATRHKTRKSPTIYTSIQKEELQFCQVKSAKNLSCIGYLQENHEETLKNIALKRVAPPAALTERYERESKNRRSRMPVHNQTDPEVTHQMNF